MSDVAGTKTPTPSERSERGYIWYGAVVSRIDPAREPEERLPLDALGDVFERAPVRLAVCFGSQATGDTHAHSDIDIAVEFAGLRPGDDGYNDAFFELYGEVASALGHEDVDLVDIHSVSGGFARALFESGVVIYGDPERFETLRESLDTDGETQSPRERLDRAIERMNEHLA